MKSFKSFKSSNKEKLLLKFSEKATKFEKIFVVLLTRASYSVRATAYLSKSQWRFFKTKVVKLYYTNFKDWLLDVMSSISIWFWNCRDQIWKIVYLLILLLFQESMVVLQTIKIWGKPIPLRPPPPLTLVLRGTTSWLVTRFRESCNVQNSKMAVNFLTS